MWANRDWVGRSLPADTPAGRELDAYARVVNAVEGNTTFYATPDAATIDRWCAATPPGFRFVFKLPREITHDRRLRNSTAELVNGQLSISVHVPDAPRSLGHLRARKILAFHRTMDAQARVAVVVKNSRRVQR